MDVAIITGGTRGIGGAIATALARRKVRLVLNGRSEDDEVRALLQGLGQLTDVRFHAGDASEAKHIR